MMKTTKVRSLTGAAALLLAATAGQPAAEAKPELADRIGEWGGTWPRVDVRNEIRIDAVTPEGVQGTFCGVRKGDGSVYFFDFGKVESEAEPDRLRMKRRKQTYWLRATGKGVSLGYQRTGQKRHRMRLRQGKMRCIGRITRPGEPIEAQAEAAGGEGLVGRWRARHDDGQTTEIWMKTGPQDGASGTICRVRKDESIAFADFGPGRRIEANAEEGEVTIERKPFKKKVTHVMKMGEDGRLMYSESVGRKLVRTLEFDRGAAEDGCMGRVRPAP